MRFFTSSLVTVASEKSFVKCIKLIVVLIHIRRENYIIKEIY